MQTLNYDFYLYSNYIYSYLQRKTPINSGVIEHEGGSKVILTL
jgi:hypothetical protein